MKFAENDSPKQRQMEERGTRKKTDCTHPISQDGTTFLHAFSVCRVGCAHVWRTSQAETSSTPRVRFATLRHADDICQCSPRASRVPAKLGPPQVLSVGSDSWHSETRLALSCNMSSWPSSSQKRRCRSPKLVGRQHWTTPLPANVRSNHPRHSSVCASMVPFRTANFSLRSVCHQRPMATDASCQDVTRRFTDAWNQSTQSSVERRVADSQGKLLELVVFDDSKRRQLYKCTSSQPKNRN